MWLLEKNIFDAIHSASKELIPTVEERKAHAVSLAGRDITATRDNVATINVDGVLTDSPNILAELFGGGNTTYVEILEGLSAANQDDSIGTILMAIDSPGGEASAQWVEVMDAVASSKKPVTALVGTMAASAAFGIASQANQILAQNRMSQVGSIGVVAGFQMDDSFVEVTSTDAPDKRPNAGTDEGKASIRAQLDSMHAVFAEAVARGRNTSLATVNEKFGKGSMLLANDAIDVGMIDGFFAINKSNKEVPRMDLNTLKEEHRGIFDAIVAQERDRVSAHLKLGSESGDMATAIKAIEEGSELTQALTAQYLAHGMKKRDIEAREEDNVSIEVEEEKVSPKALGDIIVAKAAECLGIELKGVK
ncbi:MAG: S49 family peptidase [Planctomycetota bacterium]|jgi:ClpP class serine protease